MNAINSSRGSLGDGLAAAWRNLVRGRSLNRGATWGFIILGALAAFEVFNFSTTQFALHDVLGSLSFAGLPWATVLALAFCGIDFAGIARLFTPQQGRDEPAEVWYLFAAWLLAAGFNATLTWWGVSVAIAEQAHSASRLVLGSDTVTKLVPIFVAVMVWLIRVLIIGTFSVAGDKLFTMSDARARAPRPFQGSMGRPGGSQMPERRQEPVPARPLAPSFRPAPKPVPQTALDAAESAYQPMSFDAVSRDRKLQ